MLAEFSGHNKQGTKIGDAIAPYSALFLDLILKNQPEFSQH
jgi:hypothetical protein